MRPDVRLRNHGLAPMQTIDTPHPPPGPHSHASDQHPLAKAIETRPFLVVGFCAAWCDTCDGFEPAFGQLAAIRDDATFVWLDIEDDADVAGDIDVENFPTIAIFHRRRLLHFGTSLPHASMVDRLIASFDSASTTAAAAESVLRLPERLTRMKPEAAHRALRSS